MESEILASADCDNLCLLSRLLIIVTYFVGVNWLSSIGSSPSFAFLRGGSK